MVKRIRVLQWYETNPYRNLALEEYLLDQLPAGECILYLWQNRHTVVIGRNQNVWKECSLALLEEEGGYLARRSSGGGAVYHDLGNLNFTFLAHDEDFDVEKQQEVILNALKKMKICAVKSGRNDLTVNGCKFSGNAFYHKGGRSLHHGTLLVDVNIPSLSKYLTVSSEKLRSHGVSSVRSRVTNLKNYCPKLTVDLLRQRLVGSFEEIYGFSAAPILEQEICMQEVEKLYEKYCSQSWKFGRKITASYTLEHRFAWGGIQIKALVKGGLIKEAAVFSDAMQAQWPSQFEQALTGSLFSSQAMAQAALQTPQTDELTRKMAEDVAQLLLEQRL
ncbi:lipoate--protein ligase [Youxingia wuxianensis]|uniref:lipoate--protein ligase n=1 Tax=Youxingia wuxianensis TaxID=2763678 RepID=A0A926ETY7_9FIRM|nr:lipoate--protein ligase [Youxingia wuxianensis]MBC8586429.1 lipoate--protein ligase [Youxingia wuxianensis]